MTIPSWGDSYRLAASEKWKEKSAAMGRDVTFALVEYANPKPGMHVLDLAAGAGEPAVTIASRLAGTGGGGATDFCAGHLENRERRARWRKLSDFSSPQTGA